MRSLQGSFLKMSFPSAWGGRGCSVLGSLASTVPMLKAFVRTHTPGNGVVPCGTGCPRKQLGQPLLSMFW